MCINTLSTIEITSHDNFEIHMEQERQTLEVNAAVRPLKTNIVLSLMVIIIFLLGTTITYHFNSHQRL